MKFSTFDAFHRHLEEALPDHLSSCYGIFVPAESERRYVIQRLLDACPDREITRMAASEVSVARLSADLNELSFFSSSRFLIYEGVEGIKKQELDVLASRILDGVPKNTTLVLSGAPSSQLLSFYTSVKQELILLDLKEEKPWVRKKRLLRWLIEEAQRQKKVLAPAVAEKWLDGRDACFATLCNELAAWITYSADKEVLESGAGAALQGAATVQEGWKVSEAILRGQHIDEASLQLMRQEDGHQLLAKLRYQIKMALSEDERGKMRPQQQKRYSELRAHLGERRLLEGRRLLAECERRLRVGVPAHLALTHLIGTLHRKEVE